MVILSLLLTILRLLGQAVKTSPFHGGNTGSIPVGVISVRYRFWYFMEYKS